MVQDDLSKVAEGLTTIAEFQSVGGMGFYAEKLFASAREAEK
jgi:hypothetical protein